MAGEEKIPRIIIPTATHPVEFFGHLISFVSTERDRSLRWTELSLYRTTSPQPEWVAVSSGKSVVYHAQGSSCNAGIETAAASMDLDLDPCWRCNPGPYQDEEGNGLQDKVFEVEIDFPKHRVCRSVEEIEKALMENGDKRARKGELSQPAQRLLAIAKLRDADIAREYAKPRPLR